MPSTVTLISSSPSHHTERVDAKSSIVLTFSGPVKAGTGKVQINASPERELLSELLSGSHVKIDGNTVTITPPKDLPYLSWIGVSFTEGWLLDSFGAAISVPSQLVFWTAQSTSALDMQGSDEAEWLHGSELADRIDGGGGRDDITGWGGDDILLGGDGDDQLYGGTENDRLLGGNGNDYLNGGDGEDLLEGGAGNDELRGYEGNDVLVGGLGDDALGDGQGNNTFQGGEGNDSIHAFGGVSYIDGGEGDDRIQAFNGDTVLAGDGNDSISLKLQATSNGSANGGTGNDKFELMFYKDKPGSLRLSGGSGRDTYLPMPKESLEGEYQVVITDFGAGANGDLIDLTYLIENIGYGHLPNNGNPFATGGFLRLQADANDTLLVLAIDTEATLLRLKNVAPWRLTADNFVGGYRPDGSSQGLTLTGTSGDDELRGYTVDDRLTGGQGNDSLFGGGGNDILLGGDGDDRLYARGGNDVLDGGSGNDSLSDSVGENKLRGGEGNDRIYVFGDNFVAEGNEGDDIMIASGTSGGTGGSMFGGDGNDTLSVSQGYGFYGPATVLLDGGDGDDTIKIDLYVNNMTVEALGGAGRDTFDLAGAGSNTVTIRDFQTGAGGDSIDVLDAISANVQSNPFDSSGYLRLRQDGQDTLLEFDLDGAAGSQYGWLDLARFSNTDATAFTRDNFIGGLSPLGDSVGLTLTGSDGDDKLSGAFLDDTLDGRDGNDILTGGPGKDVLRGGSGNDVLIGDNGDDLLDGGAGLDIVRMDSAHTARTRDQVKIWAENGNIKVQDLDGKGGTDTLVGIERLQLKGSTMAFDGDGSGGQIYRLYQAAFDRKPDAVGAGFWILQADLGVSLVNIAEGFVTSDEFKRLYGTNPTNEQLVDLLYHNILHRKPDAEGRAFWLDVLDRKLAPLSSVLVGFSESKENVANLAGIIGAGFEYTPWMG